MLTEDQIRKVIVLKIFRLQGCKDRETVLKHIHVMRGMLTVMLGRDPGDMDSVPDILEAVGVPFYCDHKGQYYIEQEWLDAHNIEG